MAPGLATRQETTKVRSNRSHSGVVQKRHQIFTRHELMVMIFQDFDLKPSPAIGILSIVYGKIAKPALASDLELFRSLYFLLSNISGTV